MGNSDRFVYKRMARRVLVAITAFVTIAVRTRGRERPGAAALALSTPRLTALAETQGGLRRTAEPFFVCRVMLADDNLVPS